MGCAPNVYFDRIVGKSGFPDPICRPCHTEITNPSNASPCKSHSVGYSRYQQDKKTLQSLCLVSRSLRRVAQEFMYHLYVPDNNYPQFFRFIGSVTKNLHLASSVRSLSLGRVPNNYRSTSWHSSLSSPPATNLRVFAFPPRGPESHAFSKMSLVANFIRLFPALTNLTLNEGVDFASTDHVPASLQQACELPLKSIELVGWGDGRSKYYWPQSLSRMAMRIVELSTGLRSLKLQTCFNLTHPGFSLLKLEVLHLTESWLDADEVRHILGACTGLREFVYETAHVHLWPWEFRRTRKIHLGPSDAIQALESFRGTLRSLELGFWMEDKTSFFTPSCETPSLAGFSALHNLLLEWDIICGDEAGDTTTAPFRTNTDDWDLLTHLLPESIRSVVIIDCRQGGRPERLLRALDGLAMAKTSDRFANLGHIGCDIERVYRDPGLQAHTDPFDLSSIADRLGTSGVQVDFDVNWKSRPRGSMWPFWNSDAWIEENQWCLGGGPGEHSPPSGPPPGYRTPMPLPQSDDDDGL